MPTLQSRYGRGFRIVLSVIACSAVYGVFAADATPAKPPPGHPSTVPEKPAPSKPIKKVDINNATRAELKTVGISDEFAAKIVAGRPYRSKTDLVSKGAVPEGVYVAIKDKIVINDPRKPAPKK